jgi:hypothetical protein
MDTFFCTRLLTSSFTQQNILSALPNRFGKANQRLMDFGNAFCQTRLTVILPPWR